MKHSHFFSSVLLLIPILSCAYAPKGSFRYTIVRIIDDKTHRGVPLVELTLPNHVKYYTDSAGVAALDEPSLQGREVFIEIKSHGYEYPVDAFLGRGAKVKIIPGVTHTLHIRRTMLAERLYRLTGEGIYRDSVMAGLPVPACEPLLNAQVLGQDTVSAALYQGKIFWIWGDTIGPDWWNFSVSAATSDPADDPDIAIDYDYFTDADGRAKSMLPLPRSGLVWIEGLVPMKDPQGNERLIATYTRQEGLGFPVECGLALYDDTEEIFKPWIRFPCEKEHISSHPFLHNGYWYLYPNLRVPNDWSAIQDPMRWEKREVRIPPMVAHPASRGTNIVGVGSCCSKTLAMFITPKRCNPKARIVTR